MSEFEMNESAEDNEMHNEEVSEDEETSLEDADTEAERFECPELESTEQ